MQKLMSVSSAYWCRCQSSTVCIRCRDDKPRMQHNLVVDRLGRLPVRRLRQPVGDDTKPVTRTPLLRLV